jgi:hypothetical protein
MPPRSAGLMQAIKQIIEFLQAERPVLTFSTFILDISIKA